MSIYRLEFVLDDNYFLIGFFSSKEKAESIQKLYSTAVCGFKDNPQGIFLYKKCNLKALDSNSNDFSELYYVVGWDEDENGEVIDSIYYSDLFYSKDEVDKNLLVLSKEIKKDFWSINHCQVDTCDWKEGFICCDTK